MFVVVALAVLLAVELVAVRLLLRRVVVVVCWVSVAP